MAKRRSTATGSSSRFRVEAPRLLAAVEGLLAARLAVPFVGRTSKDGEVEFVGRVLLRAERGDALVVSASDASTHDAAAEALVPRVGDDAVEPVTVDARRLASVLRSFGPAEVEADLNGRGSFALVETQDRWASLSALPWRDGDPYPVEAVRDVEDATGGLVAPGSRLLDALRFARHAVGYDPKRPQCLGYLVEPRDGGARVVVTDGTRLCATAPFPAVLSGPIRVSERFERLARFVLVGDGSATVRVGPGGAATLSGPGGRASLRSEGLDGPFVDVGSVLDEDRDRRATFRVEAGALIALADLALAHGSDRPSARLHVEDGRLVAETVDTLGGESSARVPVQVVGGLGGEALVGVNAEYLRNAAAAFPPDEVVEVAIRGRFDPIRLVGSGGTLMIAPIRLD